MRNDIKRVAITHIYPNICSSCIFHLAMRNDITPLHKILQVFKIFR